MMRSDHAPARRLKLWPESSGQPFRWLPRQGPPSWIGEWLSQAIVKALAYLPIYTSIIVTLIILLQLFGVPFIEGR